MSDKVVQWRSRWAWKWQNRWAPDSLKNIVKPRSLVLWHYVTAWGFFFTLSPCNTPKQQMTKRPKPRINTGALSDGDGSECRSDLRMVREGSHDQRMMESDGSEGTERKAGPEDDVQRTCHFSMKSRSISLSFHIVKSGEQNLGEIRRIKKCRKIKGFREWKTPTSPRLLPDYFPLAESGENLGRKWEKEQDERRFQWRKSITKADAKNGRFQSVKTFAERTAKYNQQ